MKNKPKDLNPARSKGPSDLMVLLAVAAIFGLSVSFVDVGRSLWLKSSEFSSLRSILAPLGLTASVFFLVYLMISAPVYWFLERPFKIGVRTLAVLIAFFTGGVFIFSFWSDLFRAPLSLEALFQFLLGTAAFLTLTWLLYYAKRSRPLGSKGRLKAENLISLIPFLLAEAVIFLWFYRYRLGALSSFSFPVSTGVFLLVLVGTLISAGIGRGGFSKRGKWPLLFLALIVLGAFLNTVVLKPRSSEPALPNVPHKIRRVILLTVDTLRPDVLSSYDPQGLQTPHMDEFAKEGTLFRQAISSAPWTWPSVASIMTGLSPSVLKLGNHVGRQSIVPDSLVTLAERMRDAGYYTTAIGRNSFLLPQSNLSQGFFDYQFYPRPVGKSFGGKILKRLFPNTYRTDATTSELTNLAIEWLKTHSQKDFFLWLHYFDPHEPFTPPLKFLPAKRPPGAIGNTFDQLTAVRAGYLVPSLEERAWIWELYKGEVRYVDQSIGRLIEQLKKLGIYDETLIVFSSDHGQEMWERGIIGHGHSLYHEMLWVPLIVKLPFSVSREPKEVERPVSSLDILPTILDLCDISYDRDHLSAVSLGPLLIPNSGTFQNGTIASTGLRYYEDRIAVQFDGIKYIRSLLTQSEELYDLTSDPREVKTLVYSSPELLAKGREKLKEYVERSESLRNYYHLSAREDVALDEDTLQNLKSLGYVN